LKIIVAQVINGIALGSIYALLVTGFNLMFLVGKIIHFAYPYIVVISIYACWGIRQYYKAINLISKLVFPVSEPWIYFLQLPEKPYPIGSGKL